MGLIVAVLLVVLAAIVVVVVGGPLRRARASERAAGDGSVEGAAAAARARVAEFEHARSRDELEAAREAKYREIRDTELDYRTGKLSHEDYEAINTDLRAEAIEILNRLEQLRPRDA